MTDISSLSSRLSKARRMLFDFVDTLEDDDSGEVHRLITQHTAMLEGDAHANDLANESDAAAVADEASVAASASNTAAAKALCMRYRQQLQAQQQKQDELRRALDESRAAERLLQQRFRQQRVEQDQEQSLQRVVVSTEVYSPAASPAVSSDEPPHSDQCTCESDDIIRDLCVALALTHGTVSQVTTDLHDARPEDVHQTELRTPSPAKGKRRADPRPQSPASARVSRSASRQPSRQPSRQQPATRPERGTDTSSRSSVRRSTRVPARAQTPTPATPRKASNDRALQKAEKQLQALREKVLQAEQKASELVEQNAALRRSCKEAERKLSKFAEKGKSLESQASRRKKEAAQFSVQLEAAVQAQRTAEKQLELLQQQHDELKTTQSENNATLQLQLKEYMQKAKQGEESVKLAETASEKLRESEMARKRLRNEVEELKGGIRVYCRVRPKIGAEITRGDEECVAVPDEMTARLRRVKETHGGEVTDDSKDFVFDRVFCPWRNGSQEDVFEATKGAAMSALDGFNACIFAYGQTGSGKTYTMNGLKLRFIRELFELSAQQKNDFDTRISASLVEIYLDKLGDLFWRVSNSADATPQRLVPRLNSKGIVEIAGADVREFTSADEMLEFVSRAEEARVVGSTKMNAESSRSHLILSVYVEKVDRRSMKMYSGKLSLIDLAGSESAKKTGATAQRLKEAQAINKSLSCLGNVVQQLSRGESHVSYRDSILTRVYSCPYPLCHLNLGLLTCCPHSLQDSLGGNAKTLMFVNISPSVYNIEESTGSLTYASLVKTIVNDANRDTESAELSKARLLARELCKRLEQHNIEYADIEADVQRRAEEREKRAAAAVAASAARSPVSTPTSSKTRRRTTTPRSAGRRTPRS
ncbi:MAG: hypothetical protein MHM6MM_001005 [Cercozoa sp. M6MM]